MNLGSFDNLCHRICLNGSRSGCIDIYLPIESSKSEEDAKNKDRKSPVVKAHTAELFSYGGGAASAGCMGRAPGRCNPCTVFSFCGMNACSASKIRLNDERELVQKDITISRFKWDEQKKKNIKALGGKLWRRRRRRDPKARKKGGIKQTTLRRKGEFS